MNSKLQARKEQIISGLDAARRQILEAAESIPPDSREVTFLGTWSLKDLLAHLAGWDHANQQAIQSILAGEIPAFYANHDRDWKTFNARLVAEYKKDDFNDLLETVEKSHQQLIDSLSVVPAESLEADTGVRFKGYKVTIARLMQAETEDEKIHAQQIKQWGQSLMNNDAL